MTNDRRQRTETAIAQQRKTADKSGADERVRSDERFAASRSRTEKESSRSVSKGRRENESALAKSRKQSDAALRSERKGPKRTLAAERRSADQLLRAERETADRLSQTEHLTTDAAYGEARGELGRNVSEQLARERETHDKQIVRERQSSDRTNRRAESFLTSERAEHLHTRDALALRDEFLRLLSHDLKDPMLAISMAAHRLRNKAYHIGADAEDREKVEIISRSSQEVLRLVGDLMERVALWQESPRERRRNPKGRGSRKEGGPRKG